MNSDRLRVNYVQSEGKENRKKGGNMAGRVMCGGRGQSAGECCWFPLHMCHKSEASRTPFPAIVFLVPGWQSGNARLSPDSSILSTSEPIVTPTKLELRWGQVDVSCHCAEPAAAKGERRDWG
jgi:hypothetical protein